MMNIFSKITAKTLKQNRTRTIVTIIGVILSTAMITAVTTFGVSFWHFLVDYSIARDGDWHLSVSYLAKEDFTTIADDERVLSTTSIAELGYAEFPSVCTKSPNMPYLYVQSMSQNTLDKIPVRLTDGRLPENDSEVIIPIFLQANEPNDQITNIGDTLELTLGKRTFDGEQLMQFNPFMSTANGDAGDEVFTPSFTKTFTVVGTYEYLPEMSYSTPGYEIYCGPSDYNADFYRVFVKFKNPKDAYFVYNEWLNTFDGITISDNSGLLRWYGAVDNRNFTNILYGLSAVLIIVIMGGSILLIYNAFSISLRERTVQFGLLSSIGATKKQLRNSVFFEAFAISAVGIPLGVLAGVGGIGVTLHFIGKGLTMWIHGVESGVSLRVSVPSILVSVFIALATVLLSAWIPSRRIKKISPMDAIRSTNDIKVRAKDVKTSKLVWRLFHTEGMLAQKNYKRDRRKYRTTVLSLTMSIVLFVTSTLFTTYLMRTGAFVLEAPEMELSYSFYGFDDPELSGTHNEQELMKIFSHEKTIEKIHSFRTMHVFAPFETALIDSYFHDFAENYGYPFSEDGKTVYVTPNILILPDEEFSSYAKSQGISAKEYLNTDELRGIFASDIRTYNSETGRYERQNSLTLEAGTKIALGRYDNIYDDATGTTNGTFTQQTSITTGDTAKELPEVFWNVSHPFVFIIPESMYQAHATEFTEFYPSLEFLMKCSDYKTAYNNLEKAILEAGLDEHGNLTNLAEQYESDRNLLMAVNVLTYGFVILISLISIANVFNTISTNLMLRRKEFAMLRSMGMTPKSFRKMMNFECLIYGLRSIIYGVLLSVFISFLLYRILIGGADVGFIFPWQSLLIAIAGIFIVVFITMIYTMRKIKKNNIIDELKMN